MKIIFTGGGTGGHFYPIIAVAEAIRDISNRMKLIEPILYFVSPTPYNEKILFDNQIIYKKVPAGKLRRYFSILNFFDLFKTGIGLLRALWTIFWIYPDVIFSKGGYGSFPVVWAGRILGIPIILHESDSMPGKANAWAAKIAQKIAVSYPEAAEFFPKEKTAWTGNPIRRDLKIAATEGAREYLEIESGIPVVLILGGSQGAKIINDSVIESLPELLKDFYVIHQVGKKNLKEVEELRSVLINDSQYSHRYKVFGYLDNLAMKMAAGAADVIVSRAGSTIFEIANWHKPSIIIPITKTGGDHQRKNAYIYARTGAAIVIEERNLVDQILITEIKRILENKEVEDEMVEGAKTFAKPDAAEVIAKEILDIAISH